MLSRLNSLSGEFTNHPSGPQATSNQHAAAYGLLRFYEQRRLSNGQVVDNNGQVSQIVEPEPDDGINVEVENIDTHIEHSPTQNISAHAVHLPAPLISVSENPHIQTHTVKHENDKFKTEAYH